MAEQDNAEMWTEFWAVWGKRAAVTAVVLLTVCGAILTVWGTWITFVMGWRTLWG